MSGFPPWDIQSADLDQLRSADTVPPKVVAHEAGVRNACPQTEGRVVRGV